MSQMSSKSNAVQMRMAQAAALAKIVESIPPQLFSEFGIIDKGGIDEWKMTKISPELLLPLIYCNHRAEYDHSRAFGEIRNLILRGSVGIEGFARIQGENIVTSLGPGGGRQKLMKQRSWGSRHVWGRGKPDYEEVGEE